METKKQNYTLPIIMMFALFFMIAFVTGLPAPLGVIVKNQFGASDFQATLGFAANFIAYAFMGIPAGLLLQRIGYKNTALAAIVVGFTGVAIQWFSGQMGSFTIYLIGAFVAGFSMCMLNSVVNPMLNTLGGGGKKGGQLLQAGGALNSVAATLVPVLVGYLMGASVAERTIEKASPAMFLAMGIFALTFVVLYFVNIPDLRVAKTTQKYEHSPLSFRHFVLGAGAIFMYVGIEIGIPHFANLFMTADMAKGGRAMDPAIAGTVVGTYWFLMLIGRLVGAGIAGKVSSKILLSCASSLGLVLILAAMFSSPESSVSMPVFRSDLSFGLAEVPISVMFMALCGLCTSVMWGGIYNLAVEGLGKYKELATGIFMVMVCGGGILPLVQGAVSDLGGYLTSYWVVIGALAYMLFFALIGSKNVNKNIPVD